MQDPTLSLPRQLGSSQRALPENGLIVANFYDVESGRMDLDARGGGQAHEQFDIPIPRDGGIQDLLAEATEADRRFDYVICESIERTARHMYYGTTIEHRLERAGVRLLAADEPFQLKTVDGRKPKTATQLLTRRVKQSISEFYVIDLLEKSWDGFAIHTETGYNVGKPCYGYRARHVPHPVPAKRAKGVKKTFLEPDPAQEPAVRKAYHWRVNERLGYQAIADRLNHDPAMYPAPVPVDPNRGAGRWTYSNVRDVLTNPKYTGHMVWNRRGRKTHGNRANPIEEWIWSPEPVHEPLVTLDKWLQAQNVSGHRFGSRSTTTSNDKHPETKRSYLLRTYLFCGSCGRRMNGKTRGRDIAYYACVPKKGYVPEGHPGAWSVWVREDTVLDKLNEFLSDHIFGDYRRALLDANARALDSAATQRREQHLAALRRQLDDTDRMIKNVMRNFALVDEPTEDLVRDINQQRTELHSRKADLETQLAEAEHDNQQAPNPDLLDTLPMGDLTIEDLPADLARRLFEALRLELRYDKNRNQLTCTATLSGPTVTATRDAAKDAVIVPANHPKRANQRRHDRKDQEDTMSEDTPPVPILEVPPTGIEPALYRF